MVPLWHKHSSPTLVSNTSLWNRQQRYTRDVMIRRLVSPTLACNCYVLLPKRADGAIVVDPGDDTSKRIEAILTDSGHHVAGVLATHGHPDHIWDANLVAGPKPVSVANPDHYRLVDPAATLPAGFDFELLATHSYAQAENVQDLPAELAAGSGGELSAGVPIRAVPAPGHTEGSTVYLTVGQLDAEIASEVGVAADSKQQVLLSGDVLFAGSIGRTDLPGGDHEEMLATLRTLATVIDPATIVLPGHGPATTMARELKTNPYLRFGAR